MRRSIMDMGLPELQDLMRSLGAQPYRAKQVLSWVYRKYAPSFDDMSDLPEALRRKLEETVRVAPLELVGKQEGPSEWAKRFLWRDAGKPVCESVLLSYKYGLTGCVSTQVGCPVGCSFCASALLGFERNLSAGEIVNQFVGMCGSSGERVGHLVFMGTGEPCLNYENVMEAVGRLCDETYFGLSRRKVTLSTAGIPDVIRRYSRECRGARLAVSLHATDNETRDKLVPLNKKHPIGPIFSAVRDFVETTGQRVTIEYMLLDGVNDSPTDADRLAELVRGLDCLVNLIPWNEVPKMAWRSTPPAKVRAFELALLGNQVKVTVRRRLGADIEGACGQLRREAADRQVRE